MQRYDFFRGTPTFMSYYLQNMSLGRIYSVNDLGVILDPKLKFDSHITFTVNKAMSVLGFKSVGLKNLMIHTLPNYYLPHLSVLI